MSTPTSFTYTRHPKLYFEYVYIQVQDELFKLPRYKFEEESETFRLLSPRPREEFGASWVPEKPLQFHGFSKIDFARFVSMFYPRACAAKPVNPETMELLEATLKVATSIQLLSTRQRIISHLQQKANQNPAMILLLAMKYWDLKLIMVASLELVNRDQPMSDIEAAFVGFEIAVYVFRARETRKAGYGENTWKPKLQEELERQRPKYEISYRDPEIPQNASIRRSTTFYIEEIIFLVEDELYNVTRYPFSNDSEIFSDMLSIPHPGTSDEGKNDGSPIVLEGVSKHDFCLFLEALYILPPDEPQVPWTELASLLKLCTMWRFKAIRDETISQLNTIFQEAKELAIHQLILGQSQKVPSWVIDGYHELANRDRPLTAKNRDLLTPATIWTIWELREAYTPVGYYGNKRHFIRREKTKTEVETAIADELKQVVFD